MYVCTCIRVTTDNNNTLYERLIAMNLGNFQLRRLLQSNNLWVLSQHPFLL